LQVIYQTRNWWTWSTNSSIFAL